MMPPVLYLLKEGEKVTTADAIMDAILGDFVTPTIRSIAEQLDRRIILDVDLKLDGAFIHQELISDDNLEGKLLEGVVRILVTDSAIPDRYKYTLQCIFVDEPALNGFSGIRMNGAVRMRDGAGKNEYSGFTYVYNEREWTNNLRNF